MKQIQQFQEQVLEKTVKDHFTAFLKEKGRLADFETLRNSVIVSVDGSMLHSIVNGVTQILRLNQESAMSVVVGKDQEIRFHPAIAGG